MNYYKLETIKDVLRTAYDARCVSVEEPFKEAWMRRVDGHRHLAVLAWETNERIIAEFDLYYVADALRIDGAELIVRVRAAGGLWLGPAP